MYVGIYICICTCTGQRGMLGILFSNLLFYSSEKLSFNESGAILVVSKPQRPSCLCSLQHWNYSKYEAMHA